MRQVFPGCCARAASCNVAAAPPRSVATNFRRPMVTVIRPSRARCVMGNDTTQRACSLHVQGGQECRLLPPRWQSPIGPSKEPTQRPIVHLLGSGPAALVTIREVPVKALTISAPCMSGKEHCEG